MISSRQKLTLGLLLLAVVLATSFFAGEYLSLSYLKEQQHDLQNLYLQYPARFSSFYFVLFVLLTGCGLPVTAILLLSAGAIFGFTTGTLLTTVASTCGACLSFLLSHYLFSDAAKQYFPTALDSINKGVDSEGGYYLFSIRMMAVFPFFLINILSGLTRLPLQTFIIVTALAQLILCAIFNYAGMQLGQINHWSDFLGVERIIALALMGLSPLLIHHSFLLWRKRSTALDQ